MPNPLKDQTINRFIELQKIAHNKSVAEDFFRTYLNTTPEDYIKKT